MISLLKPFCFCITESGLIKDYSPRVSTDSENDDEDDDDVSDLPSDDLVQNRIVQTVPAKEPHMDALPLKSALKKSAAAAAKQVTESKNHESR